jgi:soluble cytochrome b562
VGVEERMSVASLRDARDASTAHLEAVLKIDGASYLRLAHLRDQLDFSDQVDLKAGAGVQPQLWLDLAHRMTMEPDAKTYRLSYHGVDRIEVLLETTNLAEAKAAAEKVLAIRVVSPSGAKSRMALADFALCLDDGRGHGFCSFSALRYHHEKTAFLTGFTLLHLLTAFDF